MYSMIPVLDRTLPDRLSASGIPILPGRRVLRDYGHQCSVEQHIGRLGPLYRIRLCRVVRLSSAVDTLESSSHDLLNGQERTLDARFQISLMPCRLSA